MGRGIKMLLHKLEDYRDIETIHILQKLVYKIITKYDALEEKTESPSVIDFSKEVLKIVNNITTVNNKVSINTSELELNFILFNIQGTNNKSYEFKLDLTKKLSKCITLYTTFVILENVDIFSIQFIPGRSLMD
jgi:hypothetical protein